MSVYSKKLGKRSLFRIFRSISFRNRYFLCSTLRRGVESTNSNEFTLDGLISGITDENKHEKIDYGPPAGRELI